MRLLVATIIASACLTGSAHAQQQCLHGADSTPDQKARRSSALSVMRAINTAESAFASRNQRQYGTLKELLDTGALKEQLADAEQRLSENEKGSADFARAQKDKDRAEAFLAIAG